MKNQNQADVKTAKKKKSAPDQKPRRKRKPALPILMPDIVPLLRGEAPTMGKGGMKFVLRGFGNAMQPEVFEGDRAVVEPRQDMSLADGELVIGQLKTGEWLFGIYDLFKAKTGLCRISYLNAPAVYHRTKAFAWLYPVALVEMMDRLDPITPRAYKRIEFNLP